MIHQVDTRTLIFVALIHDIVLPSIQDFDDEFVTIGTPVEFQKKCKIA